MGISDTATAGETLVLAAAPANVEQAIEFVTDFAKGAGCPVSVLNQLSVCVDEVFANIARYAYPAGGGTVRIDVDALEQPHRLRVVFRDQGVAFNALDRQDPDTDLPADQRNIGGLGIFIMKKMVDEASYVRDGDYNVLTIVKSF